MTPRNLIRQPLPENELATLLAGCPPIPLLPPASDPVWKMAAQKPLVRRWLPDLQAQAEKELSEPLPVLTDELYRMFQINGHRLPFERVYFERRRRLARAVIMTLFYPNDKIWWESALAKWRDVFAEVSWALTAHVTELSGKDPDNIDLFAAETANLMGELQNLFSDRAPAAFTSAIFERLRHMHDLYLTDESRVRWAKMTHNWNAVCHQGVLGSALALEDDPAKLASLTARVAENLACFLDGFTPDGGCTEGPGYWVYGFGWFCALNEQLEKRTRGRLSLMEGDPLVEKIAHFGRRLTLEGEQIINFSDNHQHGTVSPVFVEYLGRRLGQLENTQLAGSLFHSLAEKAPDMHAQRFDVFLMTRLFLAAPAEDRAPVLNQESYFYPNLGIWISHGTDQRGVRWTCAVKGGNNEEHHNHNDCGSFILQLNQTVFIAELGAPEYVREFFSDPRYQFLAARSYGHSVPLINSCEQAAGKEYAARVESARFGADEDCIELELAGSYPKEAACRSARRSLTIARGAAFAATLRDEFEVGGDNRIEVALMTFIKPHQEQDGYVLEAEGRRLHVRGNAANTCPRARVPAAIPSHLQPEYLSPGVEKHFYSNHQGVKTPLYRLIFEPIVPGKTCGTEILFSLE